MKNYIKPATKIVLIQNTEIIASSPSVYDEGTDSQALGNEDFGWGDDDDPASWNWKNN